MKLTLTNIKKMKTNSTPLQKRVLQCYGDYDTKPDDGVIEFVHRKWFPYANRKIKQLAA